MSQGRFVSVAVALGAAIPTVWLTVYWTFLRGNAPIMSEWYLRILSIIWPSWLLLIS